jgi:hypothetical protein
MNGRTVFERMTNVRDQFLEEAAFVPQGGTVLAPPRRKSRDNWFTRFANSGWGVACICFVVAVAAVVGMVVWGRMGNVTQPGDTSSGRFSFAYTLQDTEGKTHDGIAETGELFSVLASVTNHGRSFRCVEWEYFPEARFVLQSDETVILTGTYAIPDFATPIIMKVETGDEGLQRFFFTVPWDATPGVYDLVLSYEGEEQVFCGALTVESAPVSYLISYGESTDVYERGQHFSIYTRLHNADGQVIINDIGLVQCENAVYIHRGEDGTEYRLVPESVEFYESSTARVFTFFIPEDAPVGKYDLCLESLCGRETYPGELTVAEEGEDITIPVAAGAIRNAYGRDIDLSLYTPTVEPTEDGGCTVTFRIYIEGLTGGDNYTVRLDADGRVTSTVSTGRGGRLDRFVGIVTPEMIADAMERIGVTDKSQLELTVDMDGFLLLVYYEYDGEGNTIGYRTERICREP